MDTAVAVKTTKINRWLPYWAVLQMDMGQTLRSWAFRIWILVMMLLSIGYLLYRTAIHQHAGMLQSAATLMGEWMQFALLAGTTLVVVLTAGTISAERGTLADSVLSRGISRYQYFFGKWHARLVTVLGSFFLVGALSLAGACFLLKYDLSITGSLLALLLIISLMAIVASCGVTISALCNSTVMGIAIMWMGIYGVGVALAILDYGQLNPMRIIRMLPALLQGQYDLRMLSQLVGWCAIGSCAAALVGIIYFSRRDI